MNDNQIRQALQEIAATEIPNETDLWPEIEPRVKRPSRPNIWQWSVKLAGTAVAILVLFLFATWFLSISRPSETDTTPIETTRIRQPETEVTPAETPEIHQDVPTYTLAPQLVFPDAPASLPRYTIEIVPPPNTPEEILDWANTFNMPNPRLFRDPRSPEQLLVVGSDDSRLLFFTPEIYQSVITYLRSDWLDFSPGETISFEAGKAAAQSFLSQHNQLPPAYQVIDELWTTFIMFNEDGYPIRILNFTPDLNGYPVVQSGQNAVGATVAVDPAGMVTSAGFVEANFAQADTVTIRPANEVIDDFINGRLIPLAQQLIPTNEGWQKNVTTYHPPLPEHTIGERVTILETDDTHILVAADGSEEVRATLVTNVGGKYELVTPDLAHIAEIIGNNQLIVTGTIEAQLAPDTWRLVVESWEIFRQQDFAAAFPSGCATGPVTLDESGAWVTAESTVGGVVKNGRYQLKNLPAAVKNGDRIEACGQPIPAVGEALPWKVIYTPPRDLNMSGNPTRAEDAFIIETARLVYFHDLEDPALALASPAWVITGYAKDNTSRFVAFLDATQ